MTGRLLRITEPAWPEEPAIEREPDEAPLRVCAVVGAVGPLERNGSRRVEVVVDGWRFVFDVQDAERARLRARASSGAAAGERHDGPLEIRAIIPGRVVAVGVAVGDHIERGQALLVVEAMKMQNELVAPRDGEVLRIAVGAGATVDLGDVLVVLG